MNKHGIRMRKRMEGVVHRMAPDVYEMAKMKKSRQIKRYALPKRKEFLFDIGKLDLADIQCEQFVRIAEHYLRHEFDLLGSGWIAYHASEEETPGYRPIAWNRDIRTGFEWDKSTNPWNYMNYPQGTDVKRVWELSRMQHMPRLALYALVYPAEKERVCNEFRDQLDDYIRSNPVGAGVNWTCSMEVAIRAINLICAYDLLKQINPNESWSLDFDKRFHLYLMNHGVYISNNLELVRNSKVGHNHYYANLLGLLFIGGYYHIPNWFKFAQKEFLTESVGQFSKDGSHFEGSTMYHRLCVEILVLGCAMMIHVKRELPEELADILLYSTRYLCDLSDGEGRIPQLGDNDSGQIMRLTCVINTDIACMRLEQHLKQYEQTDLTERERVTESFSILSRAGYFFEHSSFPEYIRATGTEKTFVAALCGGEYKGFLHYEPKACLEVEECIPDVPYYQETIFEGGNLLEKGKGWIYYEDAGVLIYRSLGATIYFHLGKRDLQRFTGHLHDDVLHCEIILNGRHMTVDPGTVTYTADCAVRNLFRSREAHFVPDYGGAFDIYGKDPFVLQRKAACQVVGAGFNYVAVKCIMNEITHYRTILVEQGRVVVKDASNQPFRIHKEPFQYYSDNYGSICKLIR